MWPGIWNRLRQAWSRKRPLRSLEDALLDAIPHAGDRQIENLRDLARESPRAAAALARLLAATRREGEAALVLERAVARWPGETLLVRERSALVRARYSTITRAWRLYHEGDPAGALKLFDEALRELGDRAPLDALYTTLAGIGWSLLELSRPLEALSIFERATRAEPGAVDGPFGAALALRALGHERAARSRLGRAGARNRGASGPIAFIGWCHYESGRWEPARRAFTAALVRQPVDGESQWGLAWTLLRQGDMAACLAAFTVALERMRHRSIADLFAFAAADPRLGALHFDIADCALRFSDAALALAAARAALATDALRGAPLLASVLLSSGRAPEVLESFDGETAAVSEALAPARVRAALMIGDAARARDVATAHPGAITGPLRAAIAEALGDLPRALATWREIDAAGGIEAAPEIDRLERLIIREPLRAWTPALARPGAAPGQAAPESASPARLTRRAVSRILERHRRDPEDPVALAQARAALQSWSLTS